MFEIVYKIWYLIAILPMIIFIEGNKAIANFLKKKEIYSGWDIWHSLAVVLIILVIILWVNGYR